MLRWQMRALAAERSERERERERATLAERQRIAREIHDLVAHSLSVTMLHVTGAKQALVEDHDVDDAVAALSDAEQVGRQAMAEIRRTVGVLATEPTGAHPLPCAEDIDALVAQVRDAGLPVDYRSRGDLDPAQPGDRSGHVPDPPGVAHQRRQARTGRDGRGRRRCRPGPRFSRRPQPATRPAPSTRTGPAPPGWRRAPNRSAASSGPDRTRPTRGAGWSTSASPSTTPHCVVEEGVGMTR